MHVRNVHERVLPTSVEKAAPLVDRLGQPDDLVFTTPAWPPMVMDRPLQVGAAGGHGDMRYSVSAYEPGRRVEFVAAPGLGIVGTHAFELTPLDDEHTVVRHVIEGRLEGGMRLAWPLAIRWVHDAMVEDLLDCAERAMGGTPRERPRWSPWVRLLRRLETPKPRRTAPTTGTDLSRVDFADAHAIACHPAAPDARTWADRLFSDFPPWVLAAMALRQAVVGLVGIERQTKQQAFETYASTANEVVLGSDAKHLDFRVAITREETRVVVTTTVQVHNARGRLYWFVVGPIHPVVIKAMLRRTARRLAAKASDH